MRARISLATVLALGIAPTLCAQTVETLPNTLPTSFSGNAFPFANTTSTNAQHVQFCYDGSEFSAKYPILIQRIRMYGSGSSTAGTASGVTIKLSVMPAPLTWNTISTTYASNLTPAKTVTILNNGNVTYPSATSAGWHFDIKLNTPYLYDPTTGPLVFDWERTGGTTGGFTGAMAGNATNPLKGSRTYGPAGQPTAAGFTASANGYACAAEITWIPASGLYSSFTATPLEGKSPLTVQFTDTTFSSAGPVQSWAWDFDGDKKIDSTLQNPKHTFTGNGYDVYFSPTLTTTDGTHPASTYTAPNYIRVNPSTASATNFGVGTTNKPAPTPISVPDNTSIYSSTTGIRGFHFVAPSSFVITGFEAPNEYTTTKQTDQVVVCYVLATPPTGAFTPTASDVKFFMDTKADQTLNAVPPITVKQGEWVGVFGACHTGASTSMRNAYAPGTYTSSVLGKSMTIERLWMNADPRTNMGIGTVNPATGTIARVLVHVAGNTAVPVLNTDGVPALGQTATLDMRAMFTGAQAGLLFLGSGQLPSPVNTPFGSLLVQPPLLITLPVANGTGTAPMPIPNDKNFTGLELFWQGAAFDLTNGLYGMTNGTKWFIGQAN